MLVPEKWTGRLVGKMHNERVTYDELAAKMGVTKSYVSMILNGARRPEGVKERMEEAFSEIIKKRKAE
jgi:transcriptional regulator with XRE-family HTH domain